MIRSEAEVAMDLGELLSLLGPAMLRGLNECDTDQRRAAHRFRTTTKRSVSRDYVADELRQALDGKGGVHIDDHDETTDFRFLSKYRARIHHAGEDFEIALGKTLQSSLFDENLTPALGEEFSPTCLYLLYVPQKADPTTVEFYLMCPGDGGWVRQLDIGGGEVVGHITSSLIDDGDGFEITIPTEERRSEQDDASD
jgi:hypothetical protein